MLSTFSGVYEPFVCPPRRSVCSGPLPIVYLDFCLPGLKSCEFFKYFGDQTLSEVSLANTFSHTVGSTDAIIP